MPRPQAAPLLDGRVLRGGPVPLQRLVRGGGDRQRAFGLGRRAGAAPGSGREGGKDATSSPSSDHFIGDVDLGNGKIFLKEDEIIR